MEQQQPQVRFMEKSVIIHRDEYGFGLRVGGQNPVFVDCVHENGAAWKAGVRKDDRIIKVNGTLVRSLDHQRVVHMIQNCTKFVNLTLHSPTEPAIIVTLDSLTSPTVTGNVTADPAADSYSGANLQSIDTNNLVSNNHNSNINNNANNSNNNGSGSITSNLLAHNHHRHHMNHSIPLKVANNLNWLSNISDDLFQDNLLKSQQQQVHNNSNEAIIACSPSSNNNSQYPQPQSSMGGISKLVVSGPSPISTSSNSHPQSNSNSVGKPKSRHNKNQSSTRDNPYYYYKTAPEKLTSDSIPSSNSSSALLNQESSTTTSTSSARSYTLTSGLSINRSRSGSKMSNIKSRKLRSRLVEDLKSLTITNSQVTPSSLSTSPSSSDLSDCDDQDSSRIDCISMNTSNSSAGALNAKPKHTTRRLEIIRELIDTEKTHTERLKHLNDLLYKPIKAECLLSTEQLRMVFSCHKTLFKVHRKIYKILLAAQQNINEQQPEPLIGKALVEIFEGELGKRLEKAASTFCVCQSTNGELLNRITRKDTKVGEFLAQVANQQMLGRLGIKDLLASCFQRLTKYPLLLENLLKATPPGSSGACGIHSKSLSEGSIATSLSASIANSSTTEELTVTPMPAVVNNDEEIGDDFAYERLCISRALNQSRQIVIHVDEAVTRAISHNKLRDIWKKTDKQSAKPEIDIESQQMLHEGPLTLRLARRSFEVYVLLLTQYLIILTREGQDKYKLKNFTADAKLPNQSNLLSPIFNIDEHLATRDTATDENGFYLLCKRKDDSRIYEFASQSPAERTKWKEKIHMAQKLCNNYTTITDDDNTLDRYRELISLATSSNTPNNIEHSPIN